jgi:hypothetical protein
MAKTAIQTRLIGNLTGFEKFKGETVNFIGWGGEVK